jgi:hypothetical protein
LPSFGDLSISVVEQFLDARQRPGASLFGEATQRENGESPGHFAEFLPHQMWFRVYAAGRAA